MADEVDKAAAEQIEGLFHTYDCLVWEIVEAPARTSDGDLPIRRADGELVGFARPAVRTEEYDLPRLPLSAFVEPGAMPARAMVSSSIIVSVLTLVLGLLLAATVLQA